MIIPEKVKILGLTWEVKRDANVSHEGNCFGSTHCSKQVFFLAPDNTPQHDREVFIHELLHALYWQMGLSKDKDLKSGDIEEKVVHALAAGLHQVLVDNDMVK